MKQNQQFVLIRTAERPAWNSKAKRYHMDKIRCILHFQWDMDIPVGATFSVTFSLLEEVKKVVNSVREIQPFRARVISYHIKIDRDNPPLCALVNNHW